jgi:hypothetical protein
LSIFLGKVFDMGCFSGPSCAGRIFKRRCGDGRGPWAYYLQPKLPCAATATACCF